MKTYRKFQNSTLGLGVLMMLACFVGHADAEVRTFTNRASWRAAAGGGTGDLSEDFNGFVTDTSFADTDVTAGFLTFSSPVGASMFHYIDASPFGTPGTLDGTSYVVLRATDNVFSTLVESEPVAAIGFDYVNLNIDGDLNLTTSRDDFLTVPESSSLSFFGIVYTEGETITSLHFPGSKGRNLAYSSDNWEAFLIPEPATVVLLGLGSLALIRRKRRG